MKGELTSWLVDHAGQLLIIVSYETISDLMTLQDQIDAFQKLIFSHFRGGANNECRIAALVPLVQESYGIYKFITSMLRAMHTSMLAQFTVFIPPLTIFSHWRR
jgi:ANTH domain